MEGNRIRRKHKENKKNLGEIGESVVICVERNSSKGSERGR
jgi:hypothetical protein